MAQNSVEKIGVGESVVNTVGIFFTSFFLVYSVYL